MIPGTRIPFRERDGSGEGLMSIPGLDISLWGTSSNGNEGWNDLFFTPDLARQVGQFLLDYAERVGPQDAVS